MYSKQMKKDLEGFFIDLDHRRYFSIEDEKKLVEKVKPEVEKFFEFYNNKFYNHKRINEIKNKVIERLPEYVKINNEYKKELVLIFNAYNSERIMVSLLAGITTMLLTNNLFLTIGAYFLGSWWVKRKGVTITKEYIKLRREVQRNLENFLR